MLHEYTKEGVGGVKARESAQNDEMVVRESLKPIVWRCPRRTNGIFFNLRRDMYEEWLVKTVMLSFGNRRERGVIGIQVL